MAFVARKSYVEKFFGWDNYKLLGPITLLGVRTNRFFQCMTFFSLKSKLLILA